jgi:hypothetical protein
MRTVAFRSSLVVAVLVAALCVPLGAAPRAADPPVIFDTIEAVGPVLVANFATELAALAASKGVAVLPTAGGIDSTITLYSGQDAEDFAPVEQNVLPGLGLDWDGALTHAKRNAGIRDCLHNLVADYFARGTDSVVLKRQMRLAAEELLHRIDQIAANAGSGVYGAGEADLSIRIEQFPIGSYGQDTYEGRFRIHFPVNEEDTGLT